MSGSGKPYRRFRARHGRSGDLDALRELRDNHGRSRRRAAAPEAPGKLTRSQRRALQRTPDPVPPPDAPVREGAGALRWAGRIAIGVVVLLLLWTVAGYLALRSASGDAQDRIAPAAERALDDAPGGLLSSAATTLIVGIDMLPGQNRSRADTIMLMRTDPDAGEIRYLSIPRDFRVIHPERGTEKINASFAIAGQAGVIRSVRRLTGLPIHHIMVVNFARFPTLVDELGGVTVNNPTELRDCPYAGGRRVSFPQGRITLDGDRALEFARVRQCDDDFARARRQQEVVRGMQEKVLSLSSLPMAPWRGAAATRALGTDMGALDLATFGWLQSRLSSDPDDRLLLSGMPQRIDGTSFVIGDPERNETEVAHFLGR